MPDQITRARQRPRMKIVIGWWSTEVPQGSWPRSSGMPEVNVQSTSKTSSSWKTPMRSSRNTLPDQRVASVRACQLRTSNGSQCAGVRAAQFFFLRQRKRRSTSCCFKCDAHFIAMRPVVSMAMLLPVLAASRLRGARVGMNGIPLQYQRCWTFSVTSWSSPDSHAHARRLNHKGSTACAAVCQPILPLRGLLVLCEPVVPLANEARRNWSHMKEEKWHRRRFLVFEADR